MKMDGRAVPIVLTDTLVERRPKVEKRQHFVGLWEGARRFLTSAASKLLDQLEESFFEIEEVVLDPGVQKSQHYAVVVDKTVLGDGTDPQAEEVGFLRAIEVEHKPACIHHYEIVRFVDEEAVRAAQLAKKGRREAHPLAKRLRGVAAGAQEALRARMGTGATGVRGTRDDRADDNAEASGADDAAGDLDGAGEFGEDDGGAPHGAPSDEPGQEGHPGAP